MADNPLAKTVILTLPGMDAVRVERDIPYDTTDPRLTYDLYRSTATSAVAVIVCGYPAADARPGFKEFGWTTSMARLLAVSGVDVVAYVTREPARDLVLLLQTLQQTYGDRVGILAASGNSPTALWAATRQSGVRVRCAAFMYGFMFDLNGSESVQAAAAEFGFANPCRGLTVADLASDLPILIVRAGRDQFAGLNLSIDAFVDDALAANLPLTLHNYPAGAHAFDLTDAAPAAMLATRAVLQFLPEHLLSA